MKRKLLLFCFFLLFPLMVKAKESCTVISGNGKDIGSEIACGSEHFYIIENKNNSLKMLSKYNLYVGTNFDKMVLDGSTIYMREENYNGSYYDYYYFENEQVNSFSEWKSRILAKYNLESMDDSLFSVNGDPYSNGNIALYVYIPVGDEYTQGNKTIQIMTLKLYPYTSIIESTEGYALQNELARGVTGPKGNANYPIYATLSPTFPRSPYNGTYQELDTFESGYKNINFVEDSEIRKYLNDYYDNLEEMGFEVTNVDLINMKEIKQLVKAISGETLPLEDWYYDSIELEEDDLGEYYHIGDLKEYVSDDYSWLWSTSYWTSTMVENNNENMYFVSSSGDICFTRSDCYGGIPRAGIRPVVTINKNNIQYSIHTKTDENGTIEVIDSAFGGDSISFRVTSNTGVKLKGIVVTTESGEKIEFTEEEITLNSNGIMSVSSNRFTMPYENVTIEAIWDITNPKTGYLIIAVISLLIACITSLVYFYKKKESTI